MEDDSKNKKKFPQPGGQSKLFLTIWNPANPRHWRFVQHVYIFTFTDDFRTDRVANQEPVLRNQPIGTEPESQGSQSGARPQEPYNRDWVTRDFHTARAANQEPVLRNQQIGTEPESQGSQSGARRWYAEP